MKHLPWILLAAVTAPAQQPDIQDGLLVRIVSDLSAVTRRTPLYYPKDAMAQLVQGTVVVRATVDSAGKVTSAAAVSGPELLTAAVLSSVKQWLFKPGANAREEQVSVEFRIPALDLVALEARSRALADQLKSPRTPRKPLAGRVVKGITVLGIAPENREKALELIAIHTGDQLSNEAMDRAEEALRQFDKRIQFKVWSLGDTDAEIILFRENATDARK